MGWRDPIKERENRNRYKEARRQARLHWARRHLGGRCVACGTTEGLEFDHIDPTTKNFVVTSKAAHVPMAALKAEVALCQLLCVTCHLGKTLAQRRGEEWLLPDPWDVPHVTDEGEDLF